MRRAKSLDVAIPPPESIAYLPEKNCWEQLPGEPDRYFTILTHYLKLGPSRTVLKAINEYNASMGETEPVKSAGGIISTEAARWLWIERANLFDKHLSQEALSEYENYSVKHKLKSIKALAKFSEQVESVLDGKSEGNLERLTLLSSGNPMQAVIQGFKAIHGEKQSIQVEGKFMSLQFNG